MKNLHNKLSDWNIREIRQIETLIREYCKTPALILFYGEYVDGTPQCAAGGYEFLVVTGNDDMVGREGLLHYIREKYTSIERIEKHISVEEVSMEHFRLNICKTLYLSLIFKEGIVLYNHESDQWENIKTEVKQKYLRSTRERVVRHLHFADSFLDASANMSIEKKYCQICPFFLYYALEQLCLAMEYHYYGFAHDFWILSHRFKMASLGSLRLYKLADDKSGELKRMFRALARQRKVCPYTGKSEYQQKPVLQYEKIIKEIRDIVRSECALPDKTSDDSLKQSSPIFI